MPKFQIDLTKMILFELSNGDDKFIGYTTDLVRRKHFIKNKVNEGHTKLLYQKIRDKGVPFKDWEMKEIEKMSANYINDVIKRRNELVITKGANLNVDDSRFDPAAYKREWRMKRKYEDMNKERCLQNGTQPSHMLTDE